MGKKSRLNKKAKGQLILSFGKIVDGETAKIPEASSLLEFTATKGEHTISGYVHPTIDQKGSIFVQWLATCGNAPINKIEAIVNECYKKHSKEAGKEVKRQFQQSDVVIVSH